MGRKTILAPLTPQEVHQDQINLRHQGKATMSDPLNTSPNKKESLRKTKKKTCESKPVRHSNFFVRSKAVQRALFSKEPILLFIHNEAFLSLTNLVPDLPSKITSLLQVFEDVFLEDDPKGLPAICGIEHQTEFVPGATLPNRPAYQTNPVETKEFVIHIDHDSLKHLEGGLMEHFGMAKTHKVLQDFYRPYMKRDLERISARCVTYKQAKSKVKSQGTKVSPIKLDYGCSFLSRLDLTLLHLSKRTSIYGKKKAEVVRQIHEKGKHNMEGKTKLYAKHPKNGRLKKIFEEGNEVFVHLREEVFPDERKSKMTTRIDDPLIITKSINERDYQLDLKGKYNVSLSFNISDLNPFVADNSDLRSNPFQEEGDDMILSSNNKQFEHKEDMLAAEDALTVPIGPMTRSRAKELQHTIKGLLTQAYIHEASKKQLEDMENQTILVLIQSHWTNKWVAHERDLNPFYVGPRFNDNEKRYKKPKWREKIYGAQMEKRYIKPKWSEF